MQKIIGNQFPNLQATCGEVVRGVRPARGVRRCPIVWILAATTVLPLLTGCQRLATSYVLDPKPSQARFDDLKAVPNPQPVLLTFDMRTAAGPFAEGTEKFAPKIARVLERSGLFSSVPQVGSESMSRIQIVLTDMAAVPAADARAMPAGLTSGLPGSEGAVLYLFTATFQPAGKEPVKKVYHHAIHVLNSKTVFPPAGTVPMTAGQATGAMVEQLTLNFLKELQGEGKL